MEEEEEDFYRDRQRRSLAAEHMVCVDLLLNKHVFAYMAPTNAPYDVVAEIGDRLMRIQVKSCIHPRLAGTGNIRYKFGCSDSNSRCNRDLREISCDVFAFVAMDTGKIVYELARSVGTASMSYLPKDFERLSDGSGWETLLNLWGG
jgi:hypothetical protein